MEKFLTKCHVQYPQEEYELGKLDSLMPPLILGRYDCGQKTGIDHGIDHSDG